MEKRILEYRNYIDEWLQEMEKADIYVTRQDVQAMIEQHLVQVGFFQQERFLHLIVTVTFALLEMLSVILTILSDIPFTLLLPIVILLLLLPYIRHYYILENEVQKMYGQYDRMLKLLCTRTE